MNKLFMLASLAAMVSAEAQAPPSPVRLSTTKSGVLPVAPTGSNYVDTLQGAIIYNGGPRPGFIGPGGTAAVQSNLPAATYTATLPSTNFNNLTGSTVRGSITGRSMQGGQGVMFTVNFTGYPDVAAYGPFGYHIHTQPVENGNCTTAMGHLDPTNRGELYACEVAKPETCQAGDLSGKHGNSTGPALTASYIELYLSTDPSSPYFFGDKSIVIHARNTTRLTCANFAMVINGTTTSSGGSSPTGSTPATVTTNAASSLSVWGLGSSALLMAIAYLI